MTAVTVKRVFDGPELSCVYQIRTTVFVEEQGCPPELEYANEDESTHFLATSDGVPCGTARWRQTDKGIKLERFAVLAGHRGKGVGTELLKAILKDIPPGFEYIYLNAQVAAVPFYESLGFSTEGESFEEAGILHRRMFLSTGSQK